MKLLVHFAIVILAGLYHAHLSCSSKSNEHGRVVDKRVLLEDNYYTIMNKIDALTKQVEDLKDQNRNLTTMYEQLHANAVFAGKEVSLYAKLTHSVQGAGRFIHYDDVIINIGNGYNENHGVFVAPVSGTYLFGLYVCAGHTEAVLNLYVNKTVKGTVLTDDADYDSCGSEVFLLTLNANDDVYVKTHDSRSANILINAAFGYPSITAVLLKTHK